MTTLFQNTDAGNNVFLNLNNATWGGSAFKTLNDGNTYTMTTAIFRLDAGSGVPTNNITAVLYAHTGTFGSTSLPTGPALSTSAAVNAATIIAATNVTFTFPDDYTMAANTAYCVIIKDPLDTGTNYVNVKTSNIAADSTHGVGVYSTDSGANWVTWTNYVSPFTVTGTLSASGITNLKTLDTNAKANIKTMNTNPIANVKTFDTNP